MHTDTTSSPWKRVKDPVDIPPGLGIQDLQQMTDAELAELIRSQLLPRDQSSTGRTRWRRFWEDLATKDLVDRATSILQDFLETTEDALDSGQLDDTSQARARKFIDQAEEAWDRITPSERGGPLAWAPRARTWPKDARRVAAVLVSEITRHREAMARDGEQPTEADQRLWESLSKVGLDPRDYPDREV